MYSPLNLYVYIHWILGFKYIYILLRDMIAHGYTCSKEQRKKLDYFNGDMCMRNGNRKHTSHATMFSLVTSMHLG